MTVNPSNERKNWRHRDTQREDSYVKTEAECVQKKGDRSWGF